LAASVVLVVETLVLVKALAVETSLVVESSLVLEVAVETVVVKRLAVVTAAATVRGATKETAKEPCSRLILSRCLPPPPAIVAGAALAGGQEEPLLSVKVLPSSSSSSRGGASSKVGLPLPPSTGVEALALLGPVEGTLDGGTKNSGTQGTETKAHDASVQGLVAGQGRCVSTQEELLVNISRGWSVRVPVGRVAIVVGGGGYSSVELQLAKDGGHKGSKRKKGNMNSLSSHGFRSESLA